MNTIPQGIGPNKSVHPPWKCTKQATTRRSTAAFHGSVENTTHTKTGSALKAKRTTHVYHHPQVNSKKTTRNKSYTSFLVLSQRSVFISNTKSTTHHLRTRHDKTRYQYRWEEKTSIFFSKTQKPSLNVLRNSIL